MSARLAIYIGAGLLVLAGLLWLRAHYLELGEQRCKERYAEAYEKQQAKDKTQREEDEAKNATLAQKEQEWHDKYDYLNSHLPTPTTIVQTKTVIRDATCSYPVSTLSADFLQSWNAAARGDTGTSPAH